MPADGIMAVHARGPVSSATPVFRDSFLQRIPPRCPMKRGGARSESPKAINVSVRGLSCGVGSDDELGARGHHPHAAVEHELARSPRREANCGGADRGEEPANPELWGKDDATYRLT